MSGVF